MRCRFYLQATAEAPPAECFAVPSRCDEAFRVRCPRKAGAQTLDEVPAASQSGHGPLILPWRALFPHNNPFLALANGLMPMAG